MRGFQEREILINGVFSKKDNQPREIYELGVSLVPADRHKQWLVLWIMNIAEKFNFNWKY